MSALRLIPVALLIVASSARAMEPGHFRVMDPFFGEALFYADEGDYFDAIARLDAELKQYHGVDQPNLDTLHYHINRAEFSVGDFELSYRMHRRAGRAIKAVIDGNVPDVVRNEAIYRLARIYFSQEENTAALSTIERIHGGVPPSIVDKIAFLKGEIFLALGRFADAGRIFGSLDKINAYKGFSAYNLAVALYAQGKRKRAIDAFDRAGSEKGNTEAILAIRDKSNLVLGRQLLQSGATQQAVQYLDRVRLKGPFSNEALLQLGWADVKLRHYARALVPWSILIKRNPTDASVQEALVGVPYVYGELEMYGKSALMYGAALDQIGDQLNRLDESIESIRRGNFLKDLVREEVYKDRDWVVKLRRLPNAPDTWYLAHLMASHGFQSSLQNYLDLEQLRRKLAGWEGSYGAFEQLIALRRAYYKPLLPVVDDEFRKLDARMRLRIEQRDMLSERLKRLLVSPDPDLLATSQERIDREQIDRIEQAARDDPSVRLWLKRLNGVLIWNIQTQYDRRLTQAFEHLDALNKDIAKMRQAYNEFVRTRQAATQSYEGYDGQIRRLRKQTADSVVRVNRLMATQGRMIDSMAIAELERRRKILEHDQVKARFAMAESYDRATLARARTREAKSSDKAKKAKK